MNGTTSTQVNLPRDVPVICTDPNLQVDIVARAI